MDALPYILIAVIGIFAMGRFFVKGKIFMKSKIARQIDHGISQNRIEIRIDGNLVKSTQDVYALICDKSYPVK